MNTISYKGYLGTENTKKEHVRCSFLCEMSLFACKTKISLAYVKKK